MAEAPEKTEVVVKKDQKTAAQEEHQAAINAYLQAPSKRRKVYVVFALSSNVDPDLASDMEKFIRAKYKQLSVSIPRNLEELKRQMVRTMALLVIDDEFDKLDALLDVVRSIKTRRGKEQVPVLFLTRRPDELIDGYHRKLIAFQESDTFCTYRSIDKTQVLGQVKNGLELRNKRRSRRYNVDIQVRFYHLRRNEDFKGQLVDLSLHGGLLKSPEIERFSDGDQLKISIPISKFIGPEEGEFLRLSARVRRVSIGGDLAGFSFEHVSSHSMYILTDYVTKMVSHQISRRQMSIR